MLSPLPPKRTFKPWVRCYYKFCTVCILFALFTGTLVRIKRFLLEAIIIPKDGG
jgi:hypothetical protein